MSAAQKFSGGCACGAVRYESHAAPVLMLNCHCRHCQQATGGAYAAIVVFPATAAKPSGEIRYHRRQGDQGAVERGFCPGCGTPVALKLERLPDLMGFYAASLDDPSLYRPAMDIFTASAQGWDHMDPALPKRPHGV